MRNAMARRCASALLSLRESIVVGSSVVSMGACSHARDAHESGALSRGQLLLPDPRILRHGEGGGAVGVEAAQQLIDLLLDLLRGRPFPRAEARRFLQAEQAVVGCGDRRRVIAPANAKVVAVLDARLAADDANAGVAG